MKRSYSWIHPLLEIRDTDLYGRGIFAKEPIKAGSVLIVMGGYICNTDQENELGEFAMNNNMDISEEWSFCPISESDLELMPQHLVNHSCEPNSGFTEQCFLTAITDINANEEVRYDYAFVMWSSDRSTDHFLMNCLCGTKSCRKQVTESDWKIERLQNLYGPYFQPFLRKKFK